jgi:hypothetical protein
MMQPAMPFHQERRARDTRSFLWCRARSNTLQSIPVQFELVPETQKPPVERLSTAQARGFLRPDIAVRRGISPKPLPADAAPLFRDLGQLLVFSFTMQRGASFHLWLDRTSSPQQRGASLCLRLDHPAELHVQRGASLCLQLNRTRTDRNRIKKHHHYTVVLVLLSIVLGHQFLRKDSTQLRMTAYL